jgi:hypothetical protein
MRVLALVVVSTVTCAPVRGPAPVALASSATLPLEQPSASQPCPAGTDLLVRRDIGGELTDGLQTIDIGANGSSARATFGDHWAERKELAMTIDQHTVLVRAGYHTDYGDFDGGIDPSSSWVHTHGDRLCFTLGVTRMDGSRAGETWMGQLALR